MKLLHLCLLLWFAAAPARGATPVATPASSRTLYLVRHGAYETGAKDNGTAPLTPLGIAQARLVAARLRGLPVAFDSLVASTMTRARQTADVVHESLPQLALTPSDLLRECTPPTWREDVMKNEEPEELAAAERQLNAAFAKYFVPAEGGERHDILVCHGNVIRWFVCKALGVDAKAWLGFSVANASLTIIQVSPEGRFKVLAVGDAGHIPPNLQSGLTRAPDPQLEVR